MTKAVTYLPTLMMLFLPLASEGFNFLLSFEPHSAHSCTATEGVHHHDNAAVGEPITPIVPASLWTTVGKVIKDRVIGEEEYRIKTVVIDPGHGGHDPGCLGANSREKHIALAVSLRLAKAMQQQYPGLKVILTRDSDVFIPLHERAAIANRNAADLFISIHCNYMPGSAATKGSETYVMGLHTAEHNLSVAKRENAAILLEDNYERNYDYDPNSPEGHIMLSMYQSAFLEQSILFAEKVEAQFARSNRKSRGVKQAGFVVLKETTMPSVLVETGFLSNRHEEAYLMTDEGQYIVASAMLNAFEEYRTALGGRPKTMQLAAIEDYQPKPKPQQTVARMPVEEKVVQEEPPLAKGRHYVARSPMPVNSPPVKTEPTIVNRTPQPASPNSPRGTARSEQDLGVMYSIQLAASPRPVDTSDPKWSNTGYVIEVVQEDQLYKYQARNFTTMQHAFEARLLLQAKGFSDAFIVAYRGGERVTLEEVKRLMAAPRP
jgi:N-acetylmuramoyl-L-alanine amidase